MKKPVIRPYASVDSLSEDAMKAIGFRFTALDLDRTKENWLRLYCTWTAESSGSSYGGLTGVNLAVFA